MGNERTENRGGLPATGLEFDRLAQHFHWRRLNRIGIVVALAAAILLVKPAAAVGQESFRRPRQAFVLPPGPRPLPPLPVPEKDGALGLRDALGDFPNVRTTARFAAKWGAEHELDPALVDRMLEGMENAWDLEVTELGWPAPFGSDNYYVNVYIDNTGAPSAEIPAGLAYSNEDPEGYPYIGMDWTLIDGYGNPTELVFLDSTLAHEFNHVLEATIGSYRSAAGMWAAWWLTEATATWMQIYLFPDTPIASWAFAEYFFTPEYPLGYADLNRPNDSPLGWRDYASGLFQMYLSEHFGPEIVRDSWTTATATDQPRAVLDHLLTARGTSLATEFASFSAHNTVYDYTHGEVYRTGARQFRQQYRPEDIHEVIADVSAAGTGDWTYPPIDTLPWGTGYNVIHIDRTAAGRYQVEVSGSETGSAGSAAVFAATIVHDEPGEPRYQPLAFEGTSGQVEVTASGQASLFLVVAAVPSTFLEGEVFDYSYLVMPVVPPTDDRDPVAAANPDEVGCGCRIDGDRPAAAPLGALWLLLLGAFARATGMHRSRVARPME